MIDLGYLCGIVGVHESVFWLSTNFVQVDLQE